MLICPDNYFLDDYSKMTRLKEGNYNSFINDLNNTIKFKDKKDKIVFRSTNRKYRQIGKKFDNFYDISSSEGPYLDKTEQHKFKYHLALYQRWDTFYFNLFSNSVPILLKNSKNPESIFNLQTFYKYYVEENKHYINCELDELYNINEKINSMEYNNLISIVNNSTDLKNTLTYDKVMDDFALFFLEYSKLFD